MLKMHAEHSADDALIAEELGHQAVTCSQPQAMECAEHTPFVAPTNDSTPPPQKSPSLADAALSQELRAQELPCQRVGFQLIDRP